MNSTNARIVDRGMIGPAAGQPREEGGKPTEAEGAVPVAGERWALLDGWAATGRRGIPWSATGHRGGDAARSWRGKAHGAPIRAVVYITSPRSRWAGHLVAVTAISP